MRRDVALAMAVAVSALGMALHTVQEFGAAALAAPSSGFLPFTLLQVALLAAWWRLRERWLTLALAALALLQLVGGAVVSVLPLPFLPFEPEQTASHYLAHAALGVAQVPLALLALRAPASRRGGAPAPGEG